MAEAKGLTQEERTAQSVALGAKLKELREAQHLSIVNIATETKIQKRYLEAMEEGDLDALPKGPYVRSFLKQYCLFLSAPDLWRAYDSLTSDKKLVVPGVVEQQHEGAEQHYSTSPKVFKSRSHAWIYLLIIASLCTAGWVTWHSRGDFLKTATSPIDGGTQTVEEVQAPSADVAPAEVPAPVEAPALVTASPDTSVDLGWMDGKPQAKEPSVDANAVSQSVAPTPAPAPVSAKGQLRLVANGVVWVKISSENNVLFQGLMQQGEVKDYFVTDKPLRVRYGNPGKTAVVWNGKETSPIAPGDKPITRYYQPNGSVVTNKR